MFDQLVRLIQDYPYPAVAILFLLCGLGLPLPEELVLLAAGYVCAKFPDHAELPLMMVWCAGAILAGDVIPYLLGRIFGVRLLRLRWLRHLVTKQRLASFDRWFRKRGDWVILIARFLPGLRVVAFFTGGAMKMPWRRFLCLDGLGILLIVPLLTWGGYRSAGFIDEVVRTVQQVERGILWGSLAVIALLGVWLWLWRRRRQRRAQSGLKEAYVQPRQPVQAGVAGAESGGELPTTPSPAPRAAATAEASPAATEPTAPAAPPEPPPAGPSPDTPGR